MAVIVQSGFIIVNGRVSAALTKIYDNARYCKKVLKLKNFYSSLDKIDASKALGYNSNLLKEFENVVNNC